MHTLAIIDPVERLHANALEFAHRWKAHALAAASEAAGAGPGAATAGSVNGSETEPLLLTQPTQNVQSGLEEVEEADSDDEAEPEEENPRDHFWRNLGIGKQEWLVCSSLSLTGTLRPQRVCKCWAAPAWCSSSPIRWST